MKKIALTAAALLTFAGAATAETAATNEMPLHSSAIEQLRTLAPDLDVTTLTPIQVNEINEEVDGDGLTEAELTEILESM
ncbi:hypothetical protein [Falsirhodobacter deserti]|uniref:hypothetical protein n=1 Tax=Falsirhodobacter deserti TaxID=1365611 RepID=UPI000FE34072|nr:hypothetical protein [Falsirhodobacter deserti]